MIIPDINLLLYAYNDSFPQHSRAKAWWESCLSGDELVGLPIDVLMGFLRITTHPKLGMASVSVGAAKQVMVSWTESHQTRILQPKEDHVNKVLGLLLESGSAGPIASDASLAVYAIDNRAVLFSNDSDFGRFKGLEFHNPLLD